MDLPAGQLPRSSFVTTVAWLAIALASVATLIGLLQNIVFAFVLPAMEEAMRSARQPEHFPRAMQFMLAHMRQIAAMALGVALALLVTAVGLLHRKNWARLAFIGFLLCGIVGNAVGVLLQNTVAPPMPPGAPEAFRQAFQVIGIAIRVMSVIMAVVISVLFAWLVRRFVSVAVKAEFTPNHG